MKKIVFQKSGMSVHYFVFFVSIFCSLLAIIAAYSKDSIELLIVIPILALWCVEQTYYCNSIYADEHSITFEYALIIKRERVYDFKGITEVEIDKFGMRTKPNRVSFRYNNKLVTFPFDGQSQNCLALLSTFEENNVPVKNARELLLKIKNKVL